MLNKVTTMGRITHTLELKRTTTGTSYINFDIAVDRDFTNDKGERDTDFFKCSAFGKTAEFISRNFTKGKLIVVCGRLENRRWQDKNGNNRTDTQIKVDDAYFCGDRTANEAQFAPPDSATAAPAFEPSFAPFDPDEELPFK